MRRPRCLTLLGIVSLLGTLLVVPAAAQPSSDELRADLQSAEERLQDIEMHASRVVEEYNAATVALEEVTTDLERTEQRLGELSTEVEALREAAGAHARRLHKLGPTLELSSVFVATGSGAEIGARGAALRRVMDGQRADLEQLGAASTELAAAEERLVEQRERALEREAEVTERREEVEATLASYQDEIASLRADVAEAEEREAEEERQRRLAAEREAEEERQRQAEREAEQQQASTQPTSSGGGTSSGGSGGGSDPAPSTRRSASTAVDTALAQVGKPYQWGGNGPSSFDCSGLTRYAWRNAGVELPRTSGAQYSGTTRISRSQLQPGDLIFYGRSGISHVAMYIGGGDVVEAPYSGQNVRVSSTGLSRSDIVGYGRP